MILIFLRGKQNCFVRWMFILTWWKPVENQRQDLGLKPWKEARQVAKTEQAGEGALKPKVMRKVGG